jgi:hypothetical protein
MKNFLVIVFVLAVAVGALGYWRGWFSVSKGDGKVSVQVHSEKFKQDSAAFSKSVSEQAKVMKGQLANLWEKAKGLTGDNKAQVEKELAELEKKQDRLEKQLQELNEAGEDKFETLKQDLSKSLEEVQQKIGELEKKLGKS